MNVTVLAKPLTPRKWLKVSKRSAVIDAMPLNPLLIAARDPACRETEGLRELRSQLILRWFSEYRTLAIVGARSGDGTSLVAANLAIAFAQLGEPTLLVDANFRTPRQHELFGLKPPVGLADLLRNRDVHEEALTPVPAIENLHVLCTGDMPDNPQELVSRTPFIYLMKTFPARFKAIIVDTPPALAYADAQIIAARSHGCVLVTRRHRTRVADIARVQSQLEPGGVMLLGAVINE